MDKKQIKKITLKAIENDPNKKDIVKISLFGSYLHGVAKKNSDVDLLVEFEPSAVVGFFKLAQIQRNFKKYFKKNIDLVTPEALSKYFRNEIINSAECIYEKR